MRLLLVTNDFPPKIGGIQTYLWNLYSRLEATDVMVLAPGHPGDTAFDRQQPFEIVRWPGRVYWPTASLTRRVRELARTHRADAVAFGAVLPMNLIGRKLEQATVVHTHGFEVAWTRLPALLQALRAIGGAASLVTVVSDYTRRFIEHAVGRGPQIELLRTGVDLDRFHVDADGSEIRKRHGLGGAPVVAHVSRLVRRKGQDVLIRALTLVRRRVPDAVALIVGSGPDDRRLRNLAAHEGIADSIVFAGAASEEELAAHYAAGDVFAMPCRSRWADLEVEGLGLVYLEAQACARPAVTGDSGGAPEAVDPGRTGFVVPGRDPRALAERLTELLGDPERARAMGRAGRRFVEQHHRWDDVVARFRNMLGHI